MVFALPHSTITTGHGVAEAYHLYPQWINKHMHSVEGSCSDQYWTAAVACVAVAIGD